jgi:hypothetical protein
MQRQDLNFLRRTMFLLALLALLAASVAQAQTTIVILRHGEKPEAGLGQLTCKGQNRALALAPLLLSRYGIPATIYAPNPAVLKNDKGFSYAYIRPLATIEPTAIRAGLPVQIGLGMEDIQPLVDQLRGKTSGRYFVAWEHHWGAALARSLIVADGGDASEVPPWDDSDFDSLYVVRITQDAQGQRSARFSHEQQNLNGLPEDCTDGPGVGRSLPTVD